MKRDGLYAKFLVHRADGKPKHKNCRYFVLDLDHDPHAAAALDAYSESCKEALPVLSKELSFGPRVTATLIDNAASERDEGDPVCSKGRTCRARRHFHDCRHAQVERDEGGAYMCRGGGVHPSKGASTVCIDNPCEHKKEDRYDA